MSASTQSHKGPNPIDLHVGARIRMRRKTLRMSQEQLASGLGLTFQQVQKYERGANRVSASKLYEIACALQIPIVYFFEGLADTAGSESEGLAPDYVRELVMSPDGLDLAKYFPRLKRSAVRREVLALVRTLAEVEK